MAGEHLKSVGEALGAPVEPPIDGYDAGDDGGDRDGRPPRAMPDDCPVVPVGTEDGLFYFLTSLGELRGLKADQVANKHIVGMFAPDSQYLIETWPRKKEVKMKDADGNEYSEWIVTGWRNDDVAMLLMDVCAQRGVWNAREKVRGRGAWKDEAGGLILHTGNRVLIRGTWLKPGLHDDLVYPTSPPVPKPARETLDAGAVAPMLTGSLQSRGIEIADVDDCGTLLLELIRTWNWERPLVDPYLLLGWNAVAMIGGALDYRPLVWMTGDAATGKTALQKLVGGLHDGGMLQSPDASEAGVRQVLGQQSLPVGIDEAEADVDNRKIQALVKLARLAATSQGNILKGGQDHKGHEFQATSCFLFSSILVPPITPAEKSRLAVLELGPLPAGAREPKLDKRELAAIGAQMRRRLADSWQRWPAVLAAYYDALVDQGGHKGRTADQFGALLAGAHILLHDGLPDAETLSMWANELKATRLAETADVGTEAGHCIEWLTTSQVQLESAGRMRMVGEWLLDATEELPAGAAQDIAGDVQGRRDRGQAALAKIGIRTFTGGIHKPSRRQEEERRRPVPGLVYAAIAVNHRGLSRVFADSKYSDGVWTQALKRTPGAIGNYPIRIGHANVRATLVPLKDMVVRGDGEGEGAEVEEDVEA